MKKHRAWLFLLVGVLILVGVDRVYVFNLPSRSVYEKTKKTEIAKAKEQGTHSPVLAFIADIEEFIDAHEKFSIVLATIAIAGFTFTLWQATEGLFRIAEQQGKDMKSSLDTMRTQERALIYGGPGINLIEKESGPIVGKIITIGNYGRSPGYVEKIEWGVSIFKEWDGKRDIRHVVVLRDVLYPNSPPVGRCPIKLPMGTEALAFYGRIYFRDIYGQDWYTTWEHRLEPSPNWDSFPLDHNAELHKA